MSASDVVNLQSVSVVRDDRRIIDDASWRVYAGERWVVLGPNGSGKTTMLSIVGALIHPSSGTATVLGETLGHTDVRVLRKRIGLVSGSIVRALRPGITVREVVLSGRRSALETWWDTYNQDDEDACEAALQSCDCSDLADRSFGVISEGERQRTLLARALVSNPSLLLLDEPFAGLDLGARERLLVRLQHLFTDLATPATVMVTHHAEEIPPATTHALLLRAGQVVAAGPIDEVFTSENVSDAFGLPIAIDHIDGRYYAKETVTLKGDGFSRTIRP